MDFAPPQFEQIPFELREIPRWMLWRAEFRHPGEKARKVPYCPARPGSRASSTDPNTWGTFKEAQEACAEGGYTGVGIVLNGDGLVGVDIDNCVVDGKPSEKSLELLNTLGASYIEISPSGTGLRAIGYGEQLATGVNGSRDGLKAEFYSTKRYLMAALKQGFDGLPVWLIGHVAKQNLGRTELLGLSLRGGSAYEADANQVL